MKHAQKGFTLIEIMIVVAIIAILAAVAIPNFIKYRATAQENSCKATMNTIATAAEAYLVANPGGTLSMNELWNETGTGFLKVTKAPTCPTDNQALTVSEETVTISGEGETAVTAKKVTVTCPTHGKVQ